ncbi:SDR family oxidoreductase [Kutzneria sp. CA-103260]|uniref:SDR family oxidoreductase n=1 Tax=Kutzneria sp. CA-103260 TaxID=2802641 RepID=UPI001BADC8CE|nr:SDR family NAD(P)-dependent oxidoreductase [Kutzneria sp. CA-103260]QUQ69363.1 short-chain dehydrogenase [Kutzneria sp. CA-103260]
MTAVVIGVGPGLGMAIAHRFGREGHAVALISRNSARHPGYLAELAAAGVKAEAFVAGVQDPERLRSALDEAADRLGPADVVYYGPNSIGTGDLDVPMASLDVATSDDIRAAMDWVYPAVDVVRHLLPGMLDRGRGTLLFAGGLSAVRPMPMIGAFAVPSAALRNYVLTLNATVADKGVLAANLIIGGLVERGDIHAHVTANEETFGRIKSLNPDDIADVAWDLHTKRDRADEVFSVFD